MKKPSTYQSFHKTNSAGPNIITFKRIELLIIQPDELQLHLGLESVLFSLYSNVFGQMKKEARV
jgi:hypothetical protein